MLSEIVTGLAAANQATQLLKELREIDKSVDEADFRLKIAELMGALADTKVALSEANLNLNEKDLIIQNLTEQLDAAMTGDICLKCKSGRLKLIKTRKMSNGGLGRYGVEEHVFRCEEVTCDFETTRVHDPQGLVPKFIAKR